MFRLQFTKQITAADGSTIHEIGEIIETDNAEPLLRDGVADPLSDEAKELLATIEAERKLLAEMGDIQNLEYAQERLAKAKEKTADLARAVAERRKKVLDNVG